MSDPRRQGIGSHSSHNTPNSNTGREGGVAEHTHHGVDPHGHGHNDHTDKPADTTLIKPGELDRYSIDEERDEKAWESLPGLLTAGEEDEERRQARESDRKAYIESVQAKKASNQESADDAEAKKKRRKFGLRMDRLNRSPEHNGD